MAALLDLDLDRLLGDLFPVRGPLFELALVEDAEGRLLSRRRDPSSGCVWVTARTIVYEADQEQLTIRDVREQEVALLPAAVIEDDAALVAQFLTGMAAALTEVLARAPIEKLEELMPHELLGPCTSALWLKRATTAADFHKAILKRSRLGHLLPADS